MPRYDFSRFWQNESLADTLVLIRIDGDVKQRIPGHGIVLANGNSMQSVLQQQLITVVVEQSKGFSKAATTQLQMVDISFSCCIMDVDAAEAAMHVASHTPDVSAPSCSEQRLQTGD